MSTQPQPGFTLPALPYAYDALDPYIDARTMEIHHGKHHLAYVTNLNVALEGLSGFDGISITDLLKQENLDRLPADRRQAVINHGGGHANHTLFWNIMGPAGGDEPTGELAAAITGVFGGFAAFKEQFTKAALTQFGSGWAWLVVDQSGKLAVTKTANQDSPVTAGHWPILLLDVWEHAYYLNYQNRRADYVTAWWNTVNWGQVAENWQSAK